MFGWSNNIKNDPKTEYTWSVSESRGSGTACRNQWTGSWKTFNLSGLRYIVHPPIIPDVSNHPYYLQFDRVRDPQNGVTRYFETSVNHSPNNTASHPRISKYTKIPLRKPQTLQRKEISDSLQTRKLLASWTTSSFSRTVTWSLVHVFKPNYRRKNYRLEFLVVTGDCSFKHCRIHQTICFADSSFNCRAMTQFRNRALLQRLVTFGILLCTVHTSTTFMGRHTVFTVSD